MDIWIQSFNFESTELTDISHDQAKKLFAEYNWSTELSNCNKSSDESCVPGFGLIGPDKTILHICPQENDSCYVHYDYSVKKKFLGFIPISTSKSHYIKSISFIEAEKLIDYHFSNEKDKIISQI